MLLENKYYRLISACMNGESAVYHLALLPDCDVYHGHFPGCPVCPGVCGIELVKECAMRLTGYKLHIGIINKCRFTALASPDMCPYVWVSLTAVPKESGYEVEARVSGPDKLYIEYKGLMLIV